MSSPPLHPYSQNHEHHAHHDEAVHGSFRSYLTGFLLSVILTAIPFGLVLTGILSPPVTASIVLLFAVIQIVVQMIFFLHLDPRSEGGWNMLALMFTLIIIIIVITGSIWVMHHLNTNMMPVHNMDAMR
jgi:cytochrome o ubiquinol oxidase operon protein cyoD